MKRLLIDQGDITQSRIEEVAPAALAEGEVRLRLQNAAITTNNITYAASGFVLKYWEFFPTGIDGQGLMPVWGTGEVVESRAEALPVGTRLYGFYPLAEELVILPEVGAQGVVTDVAQHRVKLPGVYNRYFPARDQAPQAEHLQAVLQPLLGTSYLISDWLQDNGFFEAEQVIIGSSSSKTGLGLGLYLAELSPRPVRIIGLTSAANKGFVEGSGAFDQVLSYDQVTDLSQVPSVYVDMAGNADLRRALHAHLDGQLRYSCAVGTSHWDKFQPAMELAGPKPEFFFAPAQIAKRREEWGPGVIERKIGQAFGRLAAAAGDWLEVCPHEGMEAAQQVYDTVVQGKADPRQGHIVLL